MNKRFNIFITIIAALSLISSAAEMPDSLAADTVSVKKNLYQKIVSYFENSNQVKPQKDFDISFIGGPHYSTDTKFGIGIVAAGVYRHDKTDTITQPSNVSIYFDATTSMFFKLGVRGTHFFPGDKKRWVYDVNFASIYSKFWGIGYKNNIDDANESKYKYLTAQAHSEFIWRIADNIYGGPSVTFDYINARDFAKPWLLEGESDRTFNLGVGLTLQLDTRDNMTCTQKGTYLKLTQQFNPRFLANKYAFSSTEFTASSFNPLWRGCILATNLHSKLTYGNTPWGLLPTLGGSYTMRGYYEGRFRDKCEIDACIELRQHVWHRNGVVAWIGAGTIFPKFSALRFKRVLPNYGIGYRWEFKRYMNVRLDLGFGRNQTGFIFSINEAF